MQCCLKIVLACLFMAMGASAQEPEKDKVAQQPAGFELLQISSVVNPAAFSLVEKVQWGSLAMFAPDSFKDKVPLYVYDADDFDCKSSEGGALVSGNYGIAKLDRFSSGQEGQEVPEFKSWISRDAYCTSQGSLEPEVPSEVQDKIVKGLERASIESALISFGPMSGGDPAAKFWARCDPNSLWEGSPCADRLGVSASRVP